MLWGHPENVVYLLHNFWLRPCSARPLTPRPAPGSPLPGREKLFRKPGRCPGPGKGAAFSIRSEARAASDTLAVLFKTATVFNRKPH